MAETKTKPTGASVEKFIGSVKNKTRREDGLKLLALFKAVTKQEPRMWGPSMVGFGQYHYEYDSGHSGDCMRVGFSPRAQALTLYVLPCTTGTEGFEELLATLGKHKLSKCCLYINKLDDIHLPTLKKLIAAGYKWMAKHDPEK